MALGVSDRDHLNSISLDEEEHLVRKAAGEDAPHILVEHLMMERILSDGSKRGVDFGEEFMTEGGPAFLVPIESLRHVRLGFRANDEAVAHFRRETMRA